MKYLEWNHVIGKFFFNQNNAGKEVLLYITQKEISEMGVTSFGFSNEEESWDDYCKAIKCKFPEISSKNNFIEKFIIVAHKWLYFEKIVFQDKNEYNFKIENISIYNESNNIVYPFYLGYLVSLIIPLTDNVNLFRSNNFYSPLNNFLITNEICKNKTQSIEEIDWVWNDLERWSKEYYRTDLGIFKVRHFGNHNWIYVGKAFSQCLLTPKNIRDIPNIFWKADIAPNSIIPEKQFQRIVNLHAEEQAGFNKKIVDIVNDLDNPLRKVVLDIVKREYASWKGYVIEYDKDDKVTTPKSGWIYATLFSAFNLNREDETLNHFYYLYSQNDFPEELSLGGCDVKNTGNGFSQPINIKFNQNINLTDDQNKWKASSTKNEIILYSSGSYFGLSANNFIESDKISRQSTMYLLCTDNKKNSIESWGKTFQKGDFSYINYEGVPEGFNLYRFRNPKEPHSEEEILRYNTHKKLEFRGGIKTGNRCYLKNLMPKIYIEGADGTEKLYLEFIDNSNRLYLIRNTHIPEEFILPQDIICNQNFLIKIENEDMENSDIPYQIIDMDFNPLDIVNENLTRRNGFGEISTNETYFVIGSNTSYNGWQKQMSYVFPFFSSLYDRTEFLENKINYNQEQGNLILQILSTKRNLQFLEFSEIVDSVENYSKKWEKSNFQQNPKYIKQLTISFLDYLGYLDYDYSLNKITINKPQFVIIPSTKSLKAILIGGRSKSFVESLIEKCNFYEVNLEILKQSGQLDIYYLPDIIKLTPANCKNCTEAWLKLKTIANDLDIEFKFIDKPLNQPQLIQFGLQDFSDTVYGYKKNILENKFIERPNYEWARKVFDVDKLKFVKDLNPIDKTLSLQEYYVQYRYTYIFWLDDKSYEVDRSWGKFLLLSEKNKKVIYYNSETTELAIPKDIQLPRLIAESIMLLSGEAPYYKSVIIDNQSFVYQFYQNVPKLFAENLFKKFNQEIQFKNNW